MLSSPDLRFMGHGVAGEAAPQGRSWGAAAAVVLVATGALTFDAVTPQTIEVGIFYVGIVLISLWFSHPKAALALALLATLLIILGYWITIPDTTPTRVVLLNRVLDIGTIWVVAAFVYHTRVLRHKLKVQVDIAEALSFEMDHRIGNHLQLVASFLGLQAERSSSEQVRQALKVAGSRVMTIGRIQRMLSHSTSHTIDSKSFIENLVAEVRSALLDSNKIVIQVQADSAELTPTMATALGALLLESINNAIKHAFPDGMSGLLSVSFTASNRQYIIELKDDGIGIEHAHWGFGTHNLTDITHLMRGVITHYPACQSETRPGTVWRLVIPA